MKQSLGLFISHQSALEYWRRCLELPVRNDYRHCRVALPSNPPNPEVLALAGLPHPLHVMLKAAKNRRINLINTVQHVFSGETPVGCFMKAPNDILISSPEFCFLQMAQTLSFVSLIELGYELCGTYSLPSIDDWDPPSRGFNDRTPLTSRKKLSTFVSRMPGTFGCKNAVRALRYVLDGSASPMETKLAIILVLPFRDGGYGFAPPQMNGRIERPKTVKGPTTQTSFACDLYWPGHNLAVEYDSDAFHSGSEKIALDAKRKTTLKMFGVETVTVTRSQLRSVAELEKIANVLANSMRRRMVLPRPAFTVAHNTLRRQLFY